MMKKDIVVGDSAGDAHHNRAAVTPCPLRAPLVVTIVGLPCRGKSKAAHKIARHLSWTGENAKVFTTEHNATNETLQEVLQWFLQNGNVAIIDGLHLTRQSRQLLNEFCTAGIYHHLTVEFQCNEQSFAENFRDTVSYYERNSDSTIDWTKHFSDMEKHYAPLYEPCTFLDGPLITVFNSEDPMVHSVTARGVQGALQTAILGVLSSPMIRDQVFFFSRHGESEYNILGRIGGDADLSPRGRSYAERLTRLLCTGGESNNMRLPRPRLIWTSELQRTVHTAQGIPGHRAALKELNEIDAGICEGLTYEEIQQRFPQEFAWRDQDKLKYRYPHGESYLDLLQRVDGVVQGLLTNNEVLVISHQAVLRCIMAYFKGTKPEEVPYINVPLHTLLVVRSCGYNFECETIPVNVDCVDTYRVQPKNCSPERTDADALGTVPAHFDELIPQIIN